jgi:hypothetical protein
MGVHVANTKHERSVAAQHPPLYSVEIGPEDIAIAIAIAKERTPRKNELFTDMRK